MEKIAAATKPSDSTEGSRDVKVGEKIKALRESLGMSVQDLAEKSGFSAALITQIENRMVSPPLGGLVEIANAMNVSISSFLFEGDSIYFDSLIPHHVHSTGGEATIVAVLYQKREEE